MCASLLCRSLCVGSLNTKGLLIWIFNYLDWKRQTDTCLRMWLNSDTISPPHCSSVHQCSLSPPPVPSPPPFSFTSGRKKHTFTLRYSCAGSFALRNNSNSVSKTEKMLTWNKNSKNCSGEVFIVHGPTTQPLLWLSNIPVWYFLYHNGNIALYIQM